MHSSAASQESSCSPSTVPASCSSSYNKDCSSWLLFSTFNLNHFPSLLLKSPEQASVLNPHLCWLCGQTCWALILSQLLTHVPCSPGCSTCSAILEEKAECCLLNSIPVNTSPLRATRSWIILCVILTGTHSGRGCRTSTPIIAFSPINKQCRAHSSPVFLKVDF